MSRSISSASSTITRSAAAHASRSWSRLDRMCTLSLRRSAYSCTQGVSSTQCSVSCAAQQRARNRQAVMLPPPTPASNAMRPSSMLVSTTTSVPVGSLPIRVYMVSRIVSIGDARVICAAVAAPSLGQRRSRAQPDAARLGARAADGRQVCRWPPPLHPRPRAPGVVQPPFEGRVRDRDPAGIVEGHFRSPLCCWTTWWFSRCGGRRRSGRTIRWPR